MLYKLPNIRELFKKSLLMYYMIICGMALVHLFYIFFFRSIGSTFLSVLNIFSLLFYIAMFFIFFYSRSLSVLNSAVFEVCIHAFWAALIIGPGNGFEFFIACSLFAGFNLNYITKPTKLQALFMICFAFGLLFGIRFIPGTTDLSGIRVYPVQSALDFIFIFNSLVTIAVFGAMLFIFYTFVKTDKEYLTKQNYRLTELAYMDSLTQLLNRRAMKLRLESALDIKKVCQQEFVIAIADVDDFKQINDNFGHDCGDIVLKAVVDIIKENVRSTDYVSRWGGDEILILFNQSSISGAMSTIERIHNEVCETKVNYNGEKIPVSLTIGVCGSENYYMYQDVILEADRRLNDGKQRGKHCIIYDTIPT